MIQHNSRVRPSFLTRKRAIGSSVAGGARLALCSGVRIVGMRTWEGLHMKQMIPAIAAAAFFIATPALAGAQTPPPSPSPSPTASPAPDPSQAPAPMAERRSAKAETAKGELVKVDADAKSLTIKGSDGVET